MKKNKIVFIIAAALMVLSVIGVIIFLVLSNIQQRRIDKMNESAMAYETTEAVSTEQETIEVDVDNHDGEIDEMNYDVDGTVNKLVDDLMSNELIAEYVGEDNIIKDYNEDGSCTISLDNLNSIGYLENKVPVYIVSPEGTYSSSADIVDVEYQIKNVVGQVEPAELSPDVFDDINLEKQVPNGFDIIKSELNSYINETGLLYESYQVAPIDGTEFILSGVKASGLVEDIFYCTISYEDGMGTYLNIERIE